MWSSGRRRPVSKVMQQSYERNTMRRSIYRLVATPLVLAGALAAGSAHAHFVPAPCDFITGGGWVITDSGAKVNFGAHGGCENGAFWGHVNVLDHTSSPPGHLKST